MNLLLLCAIKNMRRKKMGKRTNETDKWMEINGHLKRMQILNNLPLLKSFNQFYGCICISQTTRFHSSRFIKNTK